MGFAYGRALQDCSDLDNEKIQRHLHPALFFKHDPDKHDAICT